ncbi:MAG: hypothetical protein HQK79_20430 [Desulfobacterales bacterium]|nr:hypothetical protein [Desulfobacterales bacterium]
MNIQPQTQNLICSFGMHKGQPYTRLPISYLKWMVEINHTHKTIAEAELNRRCVPLQKKEGIKITIHAINRASQFCLKQLKQFELNKKGIHNCLTDLSLEALKKSNDKDKAEGKGKYFYAGLQWIFAFEGNEAVLKTIFPHKKNKKSNQTIRHKFNKQFNKKKGG